MPSSNRNTLAVPASPWGLAWIVNNNGTQGNADLNLPWYNTTDYATLNALVAAAGVGPYVINVTAHVHVTANLTLGVGIHLLVQPNFDVEVDNAVTFTVHSPEHVHCPYTQRAWTLTGTGVVQFTRPGTISPCWWGAVAGADSTAALAAVAALAYMDVVIPGGGYIFSSTLRFPYPVRLRGLGYDAALVTNVGAAADGIIFGAAVASDIEGFEIRDLALCGAANSCRNGLVLYRVHRVVTRNLVIVCGAVEYGLVLQGSIYDDLDVAVYRYDASHAYARPANGVLIKDDPGAMASNALRLHANINITGRGVRLQPSAANMCSVNVELSGSIETANVHAIDAQYTKQLTVHDMYLCDGNVDCLFDGCNDLVLGPGLYLNDKTVDLQGCTNARIDGVALGRLLIDADCIDTVLGSVQIYNTSGLADIVDAGQGTVYQGPIANQDNPLHDNLRVGRGGDYDNLAINGQFERWQATRADGWTDGGNKTWTQCGVGLADTRRHAGRYSAKLHLTANSSATFSTDADLLYRMRGNIGVVSLWLWVASGQNPASYPYVSVLVQAPAGNVTYDGGMLAADCDGWVQVGRSFWVPADATAITITLNDYVPAGGGVFDFYLADVSLVVGERGVSNYRQPNRELRNYLLLDEHQITYASAMPAAGFYRIGDIVFNTAPALDASNLAILGWSRLTTGTAHVSGTDWAIMRVSHVSPCT